MLRRVYDSELHWWSAQNATAGTNVSDNELEQRNVACIHPYEGLKFQMNCCTCLYLARYKIASCKTRYSVVTHMLESILWQHCFSEVEDVVHSCCKFSIRLVSLFTHCIRKRIVAYRKFCLWTIWMRMSRNAFIQDGFLMDSRPV